MIRINPNVPRSKANRLRELSRFLFDHDIKQSEIAKKIKVTRAFVHLMLNGECSIPQKYHKRLIKMGIPENLIREENQ